MPEEFAEQTETAEELQEESTEFTETEEEIVEETTESEVEEESVDYTNAEEAPATEAKADLESEDDDKDDSTDENEFTESENKAEDAVDSTEQTYTVEEYQALEAEVESLRTEIETLREFKLTVENERKDALMDSYPYNTLSAEDKADVIEHKSEYSLEEIKSKLAVIYIEKGVDFAAKEEAKDADSENEDSENDVLTFSLDGEVTGPLSDLQRALREAKED